MPQCDNPAAFRYTWPGKDESLICATCAIGLAKLAAAIGLHLQMVPLKSEDYMNLDDFNCRQELEQPHA